MNVSREMRSVEDLKEISCNLTDLKSSLTKVIENSNPNELSINVNDMKSYINKLKQELR